MAINLVIALNFLLFLGINAARVVVSLYSLNLGASVSVVGGAIAMFYVFPLLLSWPIGVLSDRFSARWLLLLGACAGAIGIVLPYFWRSLPALYIAGAMMGLTIAFSSVLGQYLMGTLSKPGERAKNFSNYSLSGSLCTFVGPLFAGFSIDHFGHPLTCLGIAALSLLGISLLIFLGGVLPVSRKRTSERSNLLGSLADRRLWRILAISSIAQVALDVFQSFIPIYGHGIGLSASAIGAVLAAMAVGSFCVRLVMSQFVARLGEEKLLAVAFVIGALSLLCLPFAKSEISLMAVGMVFGMSGGFSWPLTMMLLFSNSDEGRAGEALGLRMTVNNVWRIVGPAAFGVLASAAGLSLVFWISAALMGYGAALSHRPKRSRR